MKKLFLIMCLSLVFCWVSYAEDETQEINNVDFQITSSEDTQTSSDEDSQTSSAEDTQTASDEDAQTASDEDTQTANDENAQTASDEDTQTSSDEDSQTASDEDTQTSNDENAQTASDEDTQTASDEDTQTASDEDASINTTEAKDAQTTDTKETSTVSEGGVNLLTKIKEDIREKVYSQEFKDAYEFALKNSITTMDTIDEANMEWWLTRIAMAKMLSNYATNVLGKEPADIIVPKFSDVSEKLNEEYWNAVDLAYQLWIMWIWIDEFRPYDSVTRAEFATALSRMLYGLADWLDKYYTTHMEKLKEEWIISNTDPSLKELRWYVMIMLMRSAKAKLWVLKEIVETKLVEDYKKLIEDNQILIDNL